MVPARAKGAETAPVWRLVVHQVGEVCPHLPVPQKEVLAGLGAGYEPLHQHAVVFLKELRGPATGLGSADSSHDVAVGASARVATVGLQEDREREIPVFGVRG